jgi:MSHA biogenesis protein MshG
MATFSYSGRNKEGQKVSGTLEAASQNAVASHLLADSITPILIKESKGKRKSKAGASSEGFNFTEWQKKYFKQKVEVDELVMMCRQLHTLMKAGVVMNKAFRGLAESTRNERLKEIFLDVEQSMNQGVELAVSLKKHSDVFNELFINIVKVGENTGRLDAAFKQLAEYMEREKDTGRSIKSATRYPLFVIIAISLAMVILNIFVIPVFTDMFSKFGADLPLPTIILMGMSNLFVNYWGVMLVALVAAIYGTRYYVGTEQGRLLWDRYKLKIPLIGSILERAMLSRFARTFSLMLRSGVPLIQALEMCSRAVGNEYLSTKIVHMRTEVERGDSLLRISTNSGMFTPLVLQMIAVGEDTGQVDQLLEDVAGFYDDEVNYDLGNLSAAIEPILLVFMAGMVGMLAMGIFLPMWDMFSVMKG